MKSPLGAPKGLIGCVGVMTDWSRLAKLAGMLGSPHDGERLNAARLLGAALTREGVTFGDLATRIADGAGHTVYIDRETTIVERPTPNPAADLAHKIIDRARDRLTHSERRFLNGIVRNADMTNGKFSLTGKQANWLSMMEQTYLAPAMRKFKPIKNPTPLSQAMLDQMGLGDSVDFEGHVGTFRSTVAGERPRKIKPDPRSAGQAPPRTYHGDFDLDPLDSGIHDVQESESQEVDDASECPF